MDGYIAVVTPEIDTKAPVNDPFWLLKIEKNRIDNWNETSVERWSLLQTMASINSRIPNEKQDFFCCPRT